MAEKSGRRPSHWKQAPWEQMAQENPLFAVMTTAGMADAPSADFTPEQVESLFEKGRRVFRRNIAGTLAHALKSPEDDLVVEYGCGVGRMLNAALEAGWRRVAGIDISPTMLAHCRRLVPEVEALYPLDEAGRSDLPDGCAAAVFSFAVVQHISDLSRYLTAFDEMRRILRPGGILVVQLNCTDFEGGDFETPGRTENHETWSLHFRPGADEPYLRHEQDHWSGVYIGSELLTEWLELRQMRVVAWRRHGSGKSISVWLHAKDVSEGAAADLDPEQVRAAFEKGRRIFRRQVAGPLSHAPDPPEEGLVVQYGCGEGRMLNAALEAGWRRVAGVDASPAMLAQCRRLVPEAEALQVLDAQGRSALPDGCASAVFSFGALQRIPTLSRYLAALDEMRRLLKPGGLMIVQLDCPDLQDSDLEHPGRTENHETWSLHFRPGEDEPFQRHEQDRWNGVQIGLKLLTRHLEMQRMRVIGWRPHGADGSASIWLHARDVSDVAPVDFTPEQAEKSRRVFRKHIAGALSHAEGGPEEALIVQYGCGDGRMLNAALDAGWRRVAGVDASSSLLASCRRQVPGVQSLHILDAKGRSDLPDACASAVFSYAAVEHIDALGDYLAAFDEMLRILKPGGLLIVQLHCTDFEVGDFDRPGRTENHEAFSRHFRPGEEEPYLRHDQDGRDGVRIGAQLLARHLDERGVRVSNWSPHGSEKSMTVWLYAKRRADG